MSSNIFKLPSNFLSKNVQKALTNKTYSIDQKYPRKGRKTEVSGPLNKVNVFGALGIASMLVASYMIVKRIYYDETDTQIGETAKTPRPRTKIFSPSISGNNPLKVADQDIKDGHLRDQYNFIKKVVNECASAVFYLELRDPYIKDPETLQPIITSNGSGFIISEDGWALTNAHVVLNRPQSTITAVMRDGRSFNVRVEDADMNIDLALLKLEAQEKLPCLEFGESGDTSVGEWVVALGSPLSLSNSVTVGIVSSVNRPAEELGLRNYSMTYIQTDASITFGNSGGPLVNLDGNVIGINNLRLTSGISFAIPVEYARKFLENTKYRLKTVSDEKKSGKNLFGLTTISISPEVLTDLSKENAKIPNEITHGLLVWKIIPGTPAEKSGLEVGDIITHVNGIPVKKPVDLYNFSEARSALEIGLINKGNKKNVTLKFEE